MNIAVLFRGPLRPSTNYVRDYIAKFMSNFEDLPINPKVYLATWHPDQVDSDLSALIEHDVDNFIAIGLPDEKMMGSLIYDTILPSHHRTRNVFYQHYMSKIAIDVIASHDTYDLIIHTRTDLFIDFGDKFTTWLENDRINRYQAMHIRDVHPDSFLNDQFAVASPEIMKKAWDYKSIDALKDKIGQVIAAAGRAEDVLQLMLDEAAITATWGPVVTYYLDANRHKQ